MPTTRRRRIVRRAAMALAVVVPAVVWLTIYEPPEIERSRAIRIGMSQSEVVTIMGEDQVTWSQSVSPGSIRFTCCYGHAKETEQTLYNWFGSWLSRPEWTAPVEDWPVQVQFHMRVFDNRVERVVRGDEVEEVSHQ